MRIVGGRHRGRKLKAPERQSGGQPGGQNVRPTSDRTRESVFNILSHGIEGFDFEGASIIDLFCGTGALGLEALSRGAGHATFIDFDRTSLALVKENAATLGEWRNVTLLKIDSSRLAPPPRAAKAPCKLTFLDAPYNQGLSQPALLALVNKGWIEAGSVVVVEVAEKEPLEPPRSLEVLDERTYGAARVVFLQNRL